MERLTRDEHSSILRKFLNYGLKKFYNIGPRLLPMTVMGATTLTITTLSIRALICDSQHK